MEIRIENLDNIRAAAREFIQHMGEARVFAFYGKMGAGKTSGALCFIEWPELIEEILPDDAVRVSIIEQQDGSRLVKF